VISTGAPATVEIVASAGPIAARGHKGRAAIVPRGPARAVTTAAHAATSQVQALKAPEVRAPANAVPMTNVPPPPGPKKS